MRDIRVVTPDGRLTKVTTHGGDAPHGRKGKVRLWRGKRKAGAAPIDIKVGEEKPARESRILSFFRSLTGVKKKGEPGSRRPLTEKESTRIFQRVAIAVVLTQTLYVFGFSYSWVLLVGLFFYGAIRFATAGTRRKALAERLKPIARVPVGKYVTGLSTAGESLLSVECLIGESDFIFISHGGRELGRIPRDGVSLVSVNDRNEIAERFTLTRLIALGIHTLAAPKGKKADKYYLVIDWEGQDGTRRNGLFEFSGRRASIDAYAAVGVLHRHMRPRVARPKQGERKCIHCGRVVSAESPVCGYCGKTESLSAPQ